MTRVNCNYFCESDEKILKNQLTMKKMYDIVSELLKTKYSIHSHLGVNERPVVIISNTFDLIVDSLPIHFFYGGAKPLAI